MYRTRVSSFNRTALLRLIRRFGGIVTAEVESDGFVECFFSADSALLEALRVRFPEAKVTSGENIDWNEQSAFHSPFYREGRIELPLDDNKQLILLPGPAFGDASHPSTILALKLLLPHVLGQSVLDIGTGNGVLSLAAGIMGASAVRGVDIDEGALEIAIQNRTLNHLENQVDLGLPDQFESMNGVFDIVVANMTLGDAKEAFPHYIFSFAGAQVIILSGLLQEQKEEVVKLLPAHFSVQEELSDGQWLALTLQSMETV